MQFEPGQTIVHPQHGTAVVEAFERREVAGEERHYIVLRRAEDALTVHVPASDCEEHGIRPVISADVVEQVLATLRDAPVASTATWRQRHAEHERRLSTGDPIELAVLVRELTARDRDGGIPLSDRRLLERGRERLVSELSQALSEDPATVEGRIDAALAAR